MIIAGSPLRISLGGGGTDLPSYYREHTGFLVAAAIDRHVHIVINRTILPELILKYSQTERVTDVKDIHHPLVREAMRLVGVSAEGLEIAAMADIPAGTGLGSSGSFCTALLRALHALRNGNPSTRSRWPSKPVTLKSSNSTNRLANRTSLSPRLAG